MRGGRVAGLSRSILQFESFLLSLFLVKSGIAGFAGGRTDRCGSDGVCLRRLQPHDLDHWSITQGHFGLGEGEEQRLHRMLRTASRHRRHLRQEVISHIAHLRGRGLNGLHLVLGRRRDRDQLVPHQLESRRLRDRCDNGR